MKTVLFIALLLPSAAFARGGSTSVGPAHPAASICAEWNAQSILSQVTGTDGTSGHCRLPDGSYVDNFTLWRGFEGSEAAKALFASDFPAHHELARANGWSANTREQKYCEHLGGEVAQYNESVRKTSRFEMCEFSDRSSIDTGSLYWGASYAQELVKGMAREK